MTEDKASERPKAILADHKVAQIVEWYPAAIEVLKRHGFTQIVNPVMRRTVARRVSIAQAAEMKGVDLTTLLTDLNAVIGDEKRNS
jgi:iron-sulfur cluster repair protein YtfE (RIC family)